MFAIECSKPQIIKKVTGKIQTRNFPGRDFAEKESQTAKQTRILQRRPRKKAFPKGRADFARANFSRVSPRRPEFVAGMSQSEIIEERKSAPRRFPRKTSPQFRSRETGVISWRKRAISIRELPVKSSEEVKITKIRPPEKTRPWMSFPMP